MPALSLSGLDSDLLPPRSRYPEHEPGRANLPPPGSASGLNFFSDSLNPPDAPPLRFVTGAEPMAGRGH
jgi:hypothetical protein